MKIIKESLNEAMSSEQKVRITHKVYEYVMNHLDEALDNIAIAVASDIKEYDPNWCSDGQSKVDKLREQYQDSFAISVTNVLLSGLDNE